jgi:predicted negative regulator of RcsB-dependent stress response
MGVIISISVLSILVVILGYTTWNLLKKNEKAEDTILNYESYMTKFSDVLSKSEQKLKEVDARGAFSSDDEIGFFFTTVKILQEQLNQFRVNR